MRSIPVIGRYLFAAAVLAFGIQHIIFGRIGAYLGAPWMPVGRILACCIGIALLASGVSLAAGSQVRLGAAVVGAICVARAVICYLPRLLANLHNPDPWTNAFELLGIAGASFVLAATSTVGGGSYRRGGNRILVWLGRVLFAGSLVVFAIQHFLYARFVATLVTPWIPGKLFWAWFVGVAFIAAALAIVSGKLSRLAATLLGIMFLLWVVILHAPRVAGALHSGDEWTSLFVALAFGAAGFVVAGASEVRDAW